MPLGLHPPFADLDLSTAVLCRCYQSQWPGNDLFHLCRLSRCSVVVGMRELHETSAVVAALREAVECEYMPSAFPQVRSDTILPSSPTAIQRADARRVRDQRWNEPSIHLPDWSRWRSASLDSRLHGVPFAHRSLLPRPQPAASACSRGLHRSRHAVARQHVRRHRQRNDYERAAPHR